MTSFFLRRLINKLMPGSVKKITESGGDFKMMENITNFQTAIKRYGVPEIDCFQVRTKPTPEGSPSVAYIDI